MARERTEYPDFSWSHSRDAKLTACARRYYWHYYGSHNGWERRAPRESRVAWHLKCLTTYAMELGSVIHECAQQLAIAARDGERLPILPALHRRTSNALNALHLRSTSLDQFEEDPKRHSILLDTYYSRSIERDYLASLRAKMLTCLANLVGHSLWAELAAAARAGTLRMHVFGALANFDLDGVPVYAQPDLVFWTPASGWVIVDWKTGFADGAEHQTAIYCLLVREALQVTAGSYECRIVYLATGETRRLAQTTADLDAYADYIRRRMSVMRDLLADAARNAPRERSCFALTENRRLCRSCNFLDLCRDDLGLQRRPVNG